MTANTEQQSDIQMIIDAIEYYSIRDFVANETRDRLIALVSANPKQPDPGVIARRNKQNITDALILALRNFIVNNTKEDNMPFHLLDRVNGYFFPRKTELSEKPATDMPDEIYAHADKVWQSEKHYGGVSYTKTALISKLAAGE